MSQIDRATELTELLQQTRAVDANAIEKALRKAYSLGQTYWQQADSEYASQHRKADETAQRFNALVDETIDSLPDYSGEASTLEQDAMTLALALFCVPESEMAPETREVMRRWDRKIQLHIEAVAAGAAQ